MSRLQQVQILILLLLLAGVSLIFARNSASFAAWTNLRNILLDATPIVVGAVAMTFVIITRGIDLSIGSIANLSVASAIMLTGVRPEGSMLTETGWAVYPVALAVGMGLGFINGLCITVLRINPLIATLGTMTFYRGIGLHLTEASLISVQGAISWFGRGQFLGLGLPVWLGIAVAVTAAVILSQSVSGRQMLALGGSPRSARETGIGEVKIILVVYALVGLAGACAGLTIVGRVGVLSSELGSGLEFTVITAVVLGGTSLFGGSGSILGSLLGALLLTTIQNGLNLIGADPYHYDVIRGGILIAAVTMDTLASRIAGRTRLSVG
ncbi:ABC transporter permease [Paracoccus lichenicola]|nr:ABC transporter permease [Paracoccus lichenicola]